jgi:hypothetical protein
VAGAKLENGSDLSLLGGYIVNGSTQDSWPPILRPPVLRRNNAFLPNNALEMKLPWQA